jgi:hypothetical protein
VRRGPAIAGLLLPLLLGGCFTCALWAVDEDEDQVASAPPRHALEIRYLDGSGPAARPSPKSGEWRDLLRRLALTPFTLLLDAATAPAQCVVRCLLADDDEDASRRRRHR